MPDHLDMYSGMEAYVADKMLICQNQDSCDLLVTRDDEWGRRFISGGRGRSVLYSGRPLKEGIPGGWITSPQSPGYARLWEIPDSVLAHNRAEPGSVEEVIPSQLLVPGAHQKQNLLAAALALLDLGLYSRSIRDILACFPGVEHRLEFFCESGGIRFYNDSAATIPEATAAAVCAFEKPPILVCGGTDKNLDFSPLIQAADNAKAIVLLAGSGSEKIKALLGGGHIKYKGPFDSLDKAISAALEAAETGDNIVLSPGCTSFGMFINEFDRGLKWKEEVRKLTRQGNTGQ
jgi:UDP-N-acetylmuramoylalanine--D-glutamate ligase